MWIITTMLWRATRTVATKNGLSSKWILAVNSHYGSRQRLNVFKAGKSIYIGENTAPPVKRIRDYHLLFVREACYGGSTSLQKAL